MANGFLNALLLEFLTRTYTGWWFSICLHHLRRRSHRRSRHYRACRGATRTLARRRPSAVGATCAMKYRLAPIVPIGAISSRATRHIAVAVPCAQGLPPNTATRGATPTRASPVVVSAVCAVKLPPVITAPLGATPTRAAASLADFVADAASAAKWQVGATAPPGATRTLAAASSPVSAMAAPSALD